MRWQVAVGVGVVGLIGGGLAALVLLSPGLGSAPSGPVEPSIPSADEVAATRPATEAPPSGAPAEPSSSGASEAPGRDAPPRFELDPVFTAPVAGPEDLQVRYDRALDTTIRVDDLPDDALPGDVEKALSDRMLQATATLNAAAEAHLEFAKTAPREQATQARSRAADLYQHLSDSLRDAPIPEHFPADQAAVQRQMSQRMAESWQRKAAALRAAPVSASGAGAE